MWTRLGIVEQTPSYLPDDSCDWSEFSRKLKEANMVTLSEKNEE